MARALVSWTRVDGPLNATSPVKLGPLVRVKLSSSSKQRRPRASRLQTAQHAAQLAQDQTTASLFLTFYIVIYLFIFKTRSYSVTEADLKLIILLPPPKCQDQLMP